MENNFETNTSLNRNNNVKRYAIILILILGAYFFGFAAGEGKIRVTDGQLEITKGNAPELSADYSLLWDTLNVINTKYVDRPLDQQQLMYGAVRGLVAAAGDPYTVFLDPKEAKDFNDQLRGSFSGIGAEIGIKDGNIVVIAPLDGTPAQRAGLRSDDIIIAINDESTQGMTVDMAVSKIRGEAGTEVQLTILRKEATQPEVIKITRAKIEIKSVKLESKEVDGKKYAVIKMSQFGDDTRGLFNHIVDTVVTGSYAGVILDLRNNPGGYLEVAVDTISDWVDADKVALKEKGYDGKERDYLTQGVPRLKGIKTIVLVNGGSASASEIVAGALQDYGIATLVGEKTFGKGSVQELQNMKGNSEVKITVAKWLTPKGRAIDKVGLEPDILVEFTEEDIEAERDPQMNKALELLK